MNLYNVELHFKQHVHLLSEAKYMLERLSVNDEASQLDSIKD